MLGSFERSDPPNEDGGGTSDEVLPSEYSERGIGGNFYDASLDDGDDIRIVTCRVVRVRRVSDE